jgi:hypothetical protein
MSRHISTISQRLLAGACLLVLLSACATRSISDSGVREKSFFGGSSSSNPFYRGELTEFNVLGIDLKANVSEADIQAAMAVTPKLRVPKASSLMLIQSGAMIPDEVMVKALEKHYSVAAFTGVPETGDKYANQSRVLRLAAAKGGNEKLVVYWGLLESGSVKHGTKIVSWIPLVGGMVKDETQRMRIRLKVAIVDVKTGQWDMFLPEPFEDTDSSGRNSRAASDQAQVMLLKDKGYRAAVDELVKRYAN